ncbi:MAG: NAD(P)/FAD-dependent oxidoreductase [Methanobacteriaceae archaeon]
MIYNLAIIGGGPSGMIAAINAVNYFNNNNTRNKDHKNNTGNISSTQNNFNVIILEKNDKFGKKLLLTGGGRCNIANASPIKEQVAKFNSTGNISKSFIKNILFSFSNNDLISFFENKGINFKIEDNNRYIPESESSQDILDVLESAINNLAIKTTFNFDVDTITHNINTNSPENTNPANNKDNKDNNNNNNDFNYSSNCNVYTITNSNNDIIQSENVIIATGANFYSKTGSTGKGYEIARNLNHNVNKVSPGLIPLKVDSNYFNKYFKDLSGLTFENVIVSFTKKDNKDNNNNNKNIKIQEAGNVLISHNGISGPAILNISNDIISNNNEGNNVNDINECNNNNTEFKTPITINIDFIPNSNEEYLRNRFINDSTESGKTKVKNYMKYYLPNRFIPKFLEIANISENKTLANLNKKSRNNIIQNLKKFQLDIVGTASSDTAMISLGGIDLSEINPKTLESTILPNLYFVGELIDIHGPTGGYNLQIAFSTGYLAGKSATKNHINKYNKN